MSQMSRFLTDRFAYLAGVVCPSALVVEVKCHGSITSVIGTWIIVGPHFRASPRRRDKSMYNRTTVTLHGRAGMRILRVTNK